VNDSGGLDPAMRLTLMVALLSFTLLFAWLLLVRVQIEQKSDALTIRREFCEE